MDAQPTQENIQNPTQPRETSNEDQLPSGQIELSSKKTGVKKLVFAFSLFLILLVLIVGVSIFKFSSDDVEGTFCGGFAGKLCPENYTCTIKKEEIEGGADLSGVCLKENSPISIIRHRLGLVPLKEYEHEPIKPEKKNTTEPNENAESDVIIDSVKPNESIKSPLTVTGMVRGTWMFEGETTMKLLDSNGDEIAISFLSAQGEWMTEGLVGVTGTLEFETVEESGVLVIQKNNPSGLPENDAAFEIPVVFSL